MTIVVTGAAGFIGSHLCERLCALGHRVIGIDVFDDFLYPAQIKRQCAAWLQARAGFTLIERDICDPEAMDDTLAHANAEVLCHLAALGGVRPSLRDPLRYVRSNLYGTEVLLEACRKHGIERLVFASSSSVYGTRGTAATDLAQVAAFREDDPCLRPASPYAATKRAGELLCSTHADLYGLGISILRFFTVYGPRQRPDMAIHRFVRAIAAGDAITLFGDGSSRRDYTYITDIIDGTTAACLRVKPGRYSVYNLGATRTTSLLTLVRTIEEVVGREAVIQWLPTQAGDVPITFADISHAGRDLDYTPTVCLADGIARFWDWLQKQP